MLDSVSMQSPAANLGVILCWLTKAGQRPGVDDCLGKTAPWMSAAIRFPDGFARIGSMSLAIECHSLRKTYDGKVEALRGLDLEIR